MPQKWNLSARGASAQQRADKLRSRSDKLARQATVWESGADLEPSVRRKVDELPTGYTVFHDLVLDDGTRLDHLVVSNGGLYLVDGKRYSGRLVYSKKMLWHGRFPIVDKLETLVWEAERLSEVLGQEVVPVMCFVDAVLPQPVTTLGSVIVCRVSVLHTIVRSTHATLSVIEVNRLLDIATRLVAARSQLGPRDGAALVDPLRDPAFVSAGDPGVVTGSTPAPAWTASTDTDGDWPTLFESPDPATGPTSAISTIPPIAEPGSLDGPQREPRERRWPRRVAFAMAAVIGVALAVVIVWNVSRTSQKSAEELERNPPTTTTAATEVADTVAAPTTSSVPELASAMFSSQCRNPGTGWELRPVWPGELAGLAWYDFSYQTYDLSWQQFSVMTAADESTYEPLVVPAANTRTIRIIPVFDDGKVGDEVITTWTAPEAAC